MLINLRLKVENNKIQKETKNMLSMFMELIHVSVYALQ